MINFTNVLACAMLGMGVVLAIQGDRIRSSPVSFQLNKRHPADLPSNRSYHHRWLKDQGEGEELKEEITVPLFAGLGTHYVNIFVGTPPQRVSVIVDTGSPLMAFTCSPGCDETRCGKHTDPFFDITKSSTASAVGCSNCKATCIDNQCQISQRYSEGSTWNAFLVEDFLWLGGVGVHGPPPDGDSYAIPFKFGCQVKLSGLFIPQRENGILGLSDGENNLLHHLKTQGKISQAMFALCFSNDGGTMTIGGVIEDFHMEPMIYVPLTSTHNGWYLVKLIQLWLGESLVENRDSNILLDSGTTDTYLLKTSLARFETVFTHVTGYRYVPGETYFLTQEDFLSLPTLYFHLDKDIVLEMGPKKYMEDQGRDTYIPRIYFSESKIPILGANALSGYNIAFDLENKRVGFAAARCSFSEEGSSKHCECNGEEEAGKGKVCGMNGETYMSKCYSDCFGVGVAWVGECPKSISNQCRDHLFSGLRGCIDLAKNIFARNESTSTTSSLCMNPCWETALMACDGFSDDQIIGQLTITEDFCAMNEDGRYCRDIYLEGAHSCKALQESGCCFHHIMGFLSKIDREQIVQSNCRTMSQSRCKLMPNHYRLKPKLSPSSSSTSIFTITATDAVLIILVISVLLLYLLGPSFVREVPRKILLRVQSFWRTRHGLRQSMDGADQINEIESVGLVSRSFQDDNSLL